MKQFFSLVAVALLGSAAWGQTMVTLTVDMTNEMVSADGVHVAGNFQGWDPGATPMTDNMDGTWSYSFSRTPQPHTSTSSSTATIGARMKASRQNAVRPTDLEDSTESSPSGAQTQSFLPCVSERAKVVEAPSHRLDARTGIVAAKAPCGTSSQAPAWQMEASLPIAPRTSTATAQVSVADVLQMLGAFGDVCE